MISTHTCEHCEKSFSDSDNCWEHEQVCVLEGAMPCPFCAGIAGWDDTRGAVRCVGCQAYGPSNISCDITTGVKAWNTRLQGAALLPTEANE